MWPALSTRRAWPLELLIKCATSRSCSSRTQIQIVVNTLNMVQTKKIGFFSECPQNRKLQRKIDLFIFYFLISRISIRLRRWMIMDGIELYDFKPFSCSCGGTFWSVAIDTTPVYLSWISWIPGVSFGVNESCTIRK